MAFDETQWEQPANPALIAQLQRNAELRRALAQEIAEYLLNLPDGITPEQFVSTLGVITDDGVLLDTCEATLTHLKNSVVTESSCYNAYLLQCRERKMRIAAAKIKYEETVFAAKAQYERAKKEPVPVAPTKRK